jgi:hypothetical protein
MRRRSRRVEFTQCRVSSAAVLRLDFVTIAKETGMRVNPAVAGIGLAPWSACPACGQHPLEARATFESTGFVVSR